VKRPTLVPADAGREQEVAVSFRELTMIEVREVVRRSKSERTRTGVLKGKVPYISPEQLMARPIDARADLFALGVVLFEMLAGVRPYDGKTELATQLNVVAGKRRDLRALAPAAPAPLRSPT
jgi:serine/threonine protein kinase